MELKELQRHWNALGEQDPLFNILTRAGKEQRRWQVDEFFATAPRSVALNLQRIRRKARDFQPRRAMDFGCGVGRLSAVLCDHCDEVHGIDIAPSMLELANQYNRHPGRCHFHLNQTGNLEAFADGWFDLVYSQITLQHIENQYVRGYLREFIRVLAPGGVACFQLPTELRPPPLTQRLATSLKPLLKPLLEQRTVARLHRSAMKRVNARWPKPVVVPAPQPEFWMEMHPMPEAEVRSILSEELEILGVHADQAAGRHYHSRTYIARKPKPVSKA